MRQFVTLFVVSGFIAMHAGTAQATGPDMLSNRGMLSLCETAFSIESTPPPPEEAGKLYEAGLCHGYITGIAELLHMTNGVCLEKLDTPEVVRVYTTWVRNHPQHESKRSIDGLTESLKAAYPCEETPEAPVPTP